MVRHEHTKGYVCRTRLCRTLQSLCPVHTSRFLLLCCGRLGTISAVRDGAAFLPRDEKKTYFVALQCWLLVGTEGTPHHTHGFVRDRWLQEAHWLNMRRINAVLIKLTFLPMWAWGRESAQNQNSIFFRTCGVFACSFSSLPPSPLQPHFFLLQESLVLLSRTSHQRCVKTACIRGRRLTMGGRELLSG